MTVLIGLGFCTVEHKVCIYTCVCARMRICMHACVHMCMLMHALKGGDGDILI